MRTTLTLDDDIADFLKEQSRTLGLPFKRVVNQFLRQGMANSKGSQPSEPFEVTPHESGFLPGIDAMKLNQISDELEMEDFAGEAGK